ncbi:hypothetical protein QN277_011227 [Acacia crassicarpa]|uniref:TPX2 C-terminal domain-containing protein n=1 Tax=Acacia crassicarpa TaxID=499986 RepID=A0AAE1MY88_9FABA|nr:hypothetical protein QN277_011227 [Acacia crassicarpa]
MESASRSVGAITPVKGSRSKNKESSENINPNVNSNSPVVKSAKSQKSASKNPNPVIYSPQHKIRQRKFVVAKKKPKKEDEGSMVACKCNDKYEGNPKKCLCVAYENLRASQEEFFKNRGDQDQSKTDDRAETELEQVIEMSLMIQDLRIGDDECEGKTESREFDKADADETESPNQIGSSTVKRRRDKLLEDARSSVPESGSGRVMHLVKAFEKLRSIPMSKGSDQQQEEAEEEKQTEKTKKAMKWALPGLQPPKKIGTDDPSSSFCPSQFILTSENLGLDPQISVSSSWDSSRGSISSRSSGGRRSRRNSLDLSSTALGGRRWKKKQLKVTSQKPFKLRTEQRGKLKEEDFMRKLQEMMTEEEKQRIPIAQGLPWTTDEPECLVKPPVKESTRPTDLKLHTDLRALDRAVFDHQVAEKMSIIEQYKMERERQQKFEEEEEIRRLRKELIPKAQPMPYFDRPFIPRRSMKHPTIPREPKFHIPQHKKIKCCLSWNDISSYTYIN